MRVLLFASRDFGCAAIKHMLSLNETPVAVVVSPDDTGIDGVFQSVKQLAQKKRLLHFQTDNLKSPELKTKLRALRPDIIFSCNFPQKIPKELLNLANLGGLNFHGGLLPQYRGTLSSVWSIINDGSEVGVTLHYMDDVLDTGDIVETRRHPISDNDTGQTLYFALSSLALDLFKQYYGLLKTKIEIPRAQQHQIEGHYYSRNLPYGGKISWKWGARKVFNYCRALYFPPLPCAKTFLGADTVDVWRVASLKTKTGSGPGTIVSINEQSIQVTTATNDILLLEFAFSDRQKHLLPYPSQDHWSDTFLR